jgi:hypothetical protein
MTSETGLTLGSQRARARFRLLAAVGVVAACGVFATGCENLDGAQLVRSTLEGLARGACRSASNCSNTCPDGGEARGPLFRCPSADKLR